jgi:hypothetical protein
MIAASFGGCARRQVVGEAAPAARDIAVRGRVVGRVPGVVAVVLREVRAVDPAVAVVAHDRHVEGAAALVRGVEDPDRLRRRGRLPGTGEEKVSARPGPAATRAAAAGAARIETMRCEFR